MISHVSTSLPGICARPARRLVVAVGRGWIYGTFPGSLPHRRWLDEIVPDRPVWLRAFDGHTGWANGRALALVEPGAMQVLCTIVGGRVVHEAAPAPHGGTE